MSNDSIAITGNPISDATCMFVVDRPVLDEKSFAFLDRETAKGSPLAERLFELDGVARVVIAHNEVTVTKNSQVDWPDIGGPIGMAIREHFASGAPAVADTVWDDLPSADSIREDVQRVFDTEINPAIQSHGGVVQLIDVKDNVVYIQMGGGCQGCGQADVTLKYGIETAVRSAVPAVGQILDVTDHASGRNPYYRPSKK